jgi:ubiquinone/menaquinone biosynthesis C-methylase UbiE
MGHANRGIRQPMKSEIYTPGDSRNAADFMAKRTLNRMAASSCRFLEPGFSVLDCGCGPGSITLGISKRVAPAEVVGVDFMQSQIERGKAARNRANNLRFETADCYSLSFRDAVFDRAFSHALLEHLSDPSGRCASSTASSSREGSLASAVLIGVGSFCRHLHLACRRRSMPT